MTRARDFADLAINSSNLESVGSTGAGGKNFVINGAMQAAQRSTSETGLGATSGYYTLDRFNCAFSSQEFKLKIQDAIDSKFAHTQKTECPADMVKDYIDSFDGHSADKMINEIKEIVL